MVQYIIVAIILAWATGRGQAIAQAAASFTEISSLVE